MKSYAYAVGKIRVLERNLLPKPYLNKIAENSLEAITSELKIKEDFFSFLNNETKTTYNLIEKLLANSSLSIILRLKYEIYNLKLLFKKEADSSISATFSALGAIPPSLLKDAIRAKAFLQIPSYFREIVKTALTFFQTNQVKDMEQFLEKEMWKTILKKSKEIKNLFLEDFLKMQIDFLNIKNFPNIFIPGGRLKKEIFKQDIANIEKKTLFFYPKFDFANQEKSIDNLLTDYIKKAKTYSFGIEPLLAYLFAKEGELKNIKLILLGKLNNINPSVIKENLRETYV